MKFHENPSGGNRSDMRGGTDRQADRPGEANSRFSTMVLQTCLKIKCSDNFNANSEQEISANNFHKKKNDFKCKYHQVEPRNSFIHSHNFLKRAYKVINPKYDQKYYHLSVDRP
jgi:hypothetical protein